MSAAVCLVVPWEGPQGLGSGHHLSTLPCPSLVQLYSFLVVRAPWARMPGLEGPGAQWRAALEEWDCGAPRHSIRTMTEVARTPGTPGLTCAPCSLGARRAAGEQPLATG